MKFLCGICVGIIVAIILSGVACYFFFFKDNPQAQAKGAKQIEEKWENTKTQGDKAVHVIKTAAPAEEEEEK